MYFIFFIFPFLQFLTSCTRLPPADDDYIASLVRSKIDGEVRWHDEILDEEVENYINCTLQNELTLESAIQIALLQNPKIQSFFEELGISQSHLLEARLLSNPTFEVDIRYPSSKHLHTNIEYLISTSLLDIFLIPLRTKLASLEYEQVKLKVAHEILSLAFEVKETFYELISEKEKHSQLLLLDELTGIISEISLKQFDIGNIDTLDVQLNQTKVVELQFDISESHAKIISLSEKLKQLLGFSQNVCLHLPEKLVIDEEYFPDLCHVESLALNERLDLKVAHFEIAKLSSALNLKQPWTFTNLKVGLAGEREPDGENLLGPGFSGELPIFNYGQAARLKNYYELRQALDNLETLKIKVLSEVREAHQLLHFYSHLLRKYKQEFIPLQEKIINTSLQLYNVMGLGVNKLLENKEKQLRVFMQLIEVKKSFLLAKLKMDKALGGNFK